MNAPKYNLNTEAIDSIVQTVLSRLLQSVDLQHSNDSAASTRFHGRLLTTAQLPSELVHGQVIEVDAKTIVTDEVQDRLRAMGVVLQRSKSEAHSNSTKSETRTAVSSVIEPSQLTRPCLQVWLHDAENRSGVSSGSALPWLKGLDRRIVGQLRTVACVTQLAASLSDGQRESQHLVFSNQGWVLQKQLAQQHSVFSAMVMDLDQQHMDALSIASPRNVIMPLPATSWSVKRLLNHW